jgi:hypothetical protein
MESAPGVEPTIRGRMIIYPSVIVPITPPTSPETLYSELEDDVDDEGAADDVPDLRPPHPEQLLSLPRTWPRYYVITIGTRVGIFPT